MIALIIFTTICFCIGHYYRTKIEIAENEIKQNERFFEELNEYRERRKAKTLKEIDDIRYRYAIDANLEKTK